MTPFTRAAAAAPLAALALGATAFAAHRAAADRFHRGVAALERSVLGSLPATAVRHDLPAAIETFARRNAGVDGDRIESGPVAWRMEQTGTMRITGDGPWRPFTAKQTIGLREPGFAWFAGFRGPGTLKTQVVDAFVNDRGLLEARLMGSLPLARIVGPEADIAEAMRYVAELPWAPLAILTNAHLHWVRLEDDLYEVTLHTGSGPASARLRMENGDVVLAESDARMHRRGQYLPWRGTFGRYARIGGVRVPLRAEVGWIEEGDWRPYWRGDVFAGQYRH